MFPTLRYIILLVFLLMYAVTGLYAQTTFSYTDLRNKATKSFSNGCVTTHSPKCTTTLKKATLELKLNLGEDYELGEESFSVDVFFIIAGKRTGQPTPLKKGQLSINTGKPEQLWLFDVSDVCSQYLFFDVTVQLAQFDPRTGPVATLLQQQVQLRARVLHEWQYDVHPSASFLTPVPLPAVVTDNPVTFCWTNTACWVKNYQLQVMRLFNEDESKLTENDIRATIDWNRALTIETESASTCYTLTLSEGRGYYAWRVRPVGNAFKGGVSNPKNFGAWSSGALPHGTTMNITSARSSVFFYEQFDDTRNWIHNRIFTEGGRKREALTYANGLQQVKQNQVILHSKGEALATHTVQDHTGRPALQTLPAPLAEQDHFEYREGFITNRNGIIYTAKDFDTDDHFVSALNPTPDDIAIGSGNALNEYYSDASPENDVPSAQGYPFTRTTFFADGTERVREQSNVGRELNIQNGRANRTIYVNPSSEELIRIFGDEAPDAINVQKVINIDPNGTASVSYVEKQGQTIATCLSSIDDPAAYPEPLPSAPKQSDRFRVEEVLEERMDFGEFGSKAVKRLFFATPTTLTLDYQLSQASVEAACGSYCASCDYSILFVVKSLERNEKYTRSVTITPEQLAACGTNQGLLPVYSQSFAGLVGSYQIQMKITAGNIDPLDGNTYLHNHLKALEDDLNTRLDAALSGIMAQAIHDPDQGVIFSPEDFNDYMHANFPFADGLFTVNIAPDCPPLQIPEAPDCGETYICSPAPSFEQLLLERWKSQYGSDISDYFFTKGRSTYGVPVREVDLNTIRCTSCGISSQLIIHINGTVLASLFVPTSGETDSWAQDVIDAINRLHDLGLHAFTATYDPDRDMLILYHDNHDISSLTGNITFTQSTQQIINNDDVTFAPDPDYPYTEGPFDRMIAHMIDDGYDCDQLWQCWESLVELYETLSFDQQGEPIEEFDLLEAFLSCTGKRYEGVSDCKYGDCSTAGGYGLGYLEYAYKYFNYSFGQVPHCETVYDFASVSPAPSPTNTQWWVPDDISTVQALKDAGTGLHDIQAEGMKRWEMFYNCIHNATNTVPGGLSLQDWFDNVLILDMKTTCEELCEARKEEFKTALVNFLLDNGFTRQIRNGQQVLVSPTQSRVITQFFLDCIVAEFVFDCQADCGVTPVMQGGQMMSAMTTEEIAHLQNLFQGTWKFHIPELLFGDYDNPNSCPDDGQDWRLLDTGDYAHCPLNFCYCWTPRPLPILPQGFVYIYKDCPQLSLDHITNQINQQRFDLIAQAKAGFERQYRQNCTNKTTITDRFALAYDLDYHHFTLYYYDRAGNLVKTVAPQGVNTLDPIPSRNDPAAATRHDYKTEYAYNSLKQLIRQQSPDGGTTYFIYDNKGQLRFSQNQKQLRTQGAYAYTKYDRLGRIIEVGKSRQANKATPTNTLASGNLNGFQALEAFAGDPDFPDDDAHSSERIYTFYTQPATGVTYLNGSPQRYLRNRVSHTLVENPEAITLGFKRRWVATYFSYDPHGNVEWIMQDIPHIGRHYIRYEYDLYSGNVNRVIFNEGRVDQFLHRYRYDEDNRITQVETSIDGIIWDRDARYTYYPHGPLKRTLLGEDQVQGMDYAYTIQGWLKAINHPKLQEHLDPGKDAFASSKVAKDAFGMALQYFEGDFSKSRSTLDPAADASMLVPGTKPLYNGNISGWSSNIQPNPDGLVNQYEQLIARRFKYDELNRIRDSELLAFNDQSQMYDQTGDYHSTYTYYANGNIHQLQRDAYGANREMDKFTYHYKTKPNNQLDHITDNAVNDGAFDDITSQAPGNYRYDDIGNLIKDKSEKMIVTWNLLNKVHRVKKYSDGSFDDTKLTEIIEFDYDAAGNRVAKKVFQPSAEPGFLLLKQATFYVRDASGNVMGIYELGQKSLPGGRRPIPDGRILLNEIPLYGSSRIGVYRPCREVEILPDFGGPKTNPGKTFPIEFDGDLIKRRDIIIDDMSLAASRCVECKIYSLQDHLINERVQVSDIKLPVDIRDLSLGFRSKLLSYQNYYPFGGLEKGRTYSMSQYKYGFNGKLFDTEWHGKVGSIYDYGFRIYNPWCGCFLSVDPMFRSYPWYSSYQFAGNNPIKFIDLDGLEEIDPAETVNFLPRLIKTTFWEIAHSAINLGLGAATHFSGVRPRAVYPKDVDGNEVFGVEIVYEPISWKHIATVPLDAINIIAAGKIDPTDIISGKTGTTTQTTKVAKDAIEKVEDHVNIHRIGGSKAENLSIKPREELENPPGISALKEGTAEEAAEQIKEAFPNATRLHEKAKVVGTSTAKKIREAGFDVANTPSKKLPNHVTIFHPQGVPAFKNPVNQRRLLEAFHDRDL